MMEFVEPALVTGPATGDLKIWLDNFQQIDGNERVQYQMCAIQEAQHPSILVQAAQSLLAGTDVYPQHIRNDFQAKGYDGVPLHACYMDLCDCYMHDRWTTATGADSLAFPYEMRQRANLGLVTCPAYWEASQWTYHDGILFQDRTARTAVVECDNCYQNEARVKGHAIQDYNSGRRLSQDSGDFLKSHQIYTNIFEVLKQNGYGEQVSEFLSGEWCECWSRVWYEEGGLAFRDLVTFAEWDAIVTGDAQGDLLTQFVNHYASEGRLLESQEPAREGNGRRLASSCPSRGMRGCHPPSATVTLASGADLRLDALKVGDAIRTPSGVEPVVGFLHADKHATMDFHVFTTAANHKITISDKHFLLVDGVETDPATVKIGQRLTTVDGPQPITAIAKETHVGAYHLITPSGAYFVDGVAASTYVAYIPHAAWKVFGDGYITLRYMLGLPIVAEGDAPVTLFWLLDALKAAGVPDAVQSSVFWPLIAGSVVATELASAIGMTAAAKLPTLALLAAPLAFKMVK